MNSANIANTNQQLLVIKLHLSRLLQVGSDTSAGNSVIFKKAYSQALCFHFVLAYRAFMQELAGDYNIVVAASGSFHELCLKLEAQGVICQQCELLADLEGDPGSWLSWLLEQYKSCLALSSTPAAVASSAAVQLIGVKDLTEIVFQEQFQSAFTQFDELVSQYRTLMQEW